VVDALSHLVQAEAHRVLSQAQIAPDCRLLMLLQFKTIYTRSVQRRS